MGWENVLLYWPMCGRLAGRIISDNCTRSRPPMTVYVGVEVLSGWFINNYDIAMV
jgi:hypothetical protein